MDAQTELFNISRKILTRKSKYEAIASEFGLPNYRVITSSELAIRGKDIDLPKHIRSFVNEYGEVVIMANIICGKVRGMILRALNTKAFLSYGFREGALYGLGMLSPDFKYGDPILLVESAIDSDFARLFITRNVLALMTSSVSVGKAQVISCLTNRVLLFLDNDEAGRRGEDKTKRKLEELGISVSVIPKISGLKDLGDLIDMKRRGDLFTNTIIEDIKHSVEVRGGKVL